MAWIGWSLMGRRRVLWGLLLAALGLTTACVPGFLRSDSDDGLSPVTTVNVPPNEVSMMPSGTF